MPTFVRTFSVVGILSVSIFGRHFVRILKNVIIRVSVSEALYSQKISSHIGKKPI